MSADGNKIVATVQGGLIYTSTNAGNTWTSSSSPSTNWSNLASSADGNRLAALANAGTGLGGESACWLFTSSDGGATWAQCSLTEAVYSSLAMSADGNRLVLLPGSTYMGGPLDYTTNFGDSWSSLPGPFRAFSITSAADGWHLFVSCLVAAPSFGELHASTNFGVTWNLTGETGMDASYWSLTSSADGRTLLGNSYSTWQLHVSTNYGVMRTVANLPILGGYGGWSPACSADGSIIVAASNKGHWPPPIVNLFYFSTNSGITWVEGTPPSTNGLLITVALSADGQRMAAILNGGGIYTRQTTPSPKLNITPTASGLLISWVVPSMPFVLQESADLTTAIWIDVTTAPKLNFTNLHHEVSMRVSSANRFYRLKSL